MWSVMCSMLLAGLPAPVPDAPPVWTIAADGSMVELYAVPIVGELPADEPENVHTSKPTTTPQKQGIRLVAFTASWCADCLEVKPTVKEMQDRDYSIELADADDPAHAATLQKHRIKQLPAFIMYYDDKPVNYCEGKQSRKSLVDWITEEQIRRTESGPLADPINAEFFRENHWALSRGTCGMLGCSQHGGGWVLKKGPAPSKSGGYSSSSSPAPQRVGLIQRVRSWGRGRR